MLYSEVRSQKLKFQVITTGSPILTKDVCMALKLIRGVDAINLQNIDINTEDYAKKLVNEYNDVFTGLGRIE